MEALLNMDTDGDGEISEFEFIKFMMMQAGMADEETLDTLHKRVHIYIYMDNFVKLIFHLYIVVILM